MIKEISSFSEVPVGGETFVVYDANVAWIAEQIISRGAVGAVAVEATEENKTMETVMLLCRSMMEAGLSRGGEVICIGGGITSDIGGFAASIYKRGIPYVNVPTTLLAQVDAGIGGKTGVNLDSYKNMLGVIVEPRVTYICADAIRTLPRRELLCGVAELVKTFLIADRAAYEEFCRCASPTSAVFINRAAGIKQGIVAEDLYEKASLLSSRPSEARGEISRAVLNFGHTFAHGIEHVAGLRGDDVAHGEAVAMGMILAAKLGDRLHGTALAPRLEADFERIGLPVKCPYAPEELVGAMERDKKAAGEKVRFVLLEDIGKPIFEMLAPDEAVDILSR